jgi:hypothetical protein
MAAAGLKMPYFDPIISKKKPYFFQPGHVDSKIGKERSGVRLIHNNFIHVYHLNPNCPKN